MRALSGACCDDCARGRKSCSGNGRARPLRGVGFLTNCVQPRRPGSVGLWDPRVPGQTWPEPNRSPNRPYILGVGAAPTRGAVGLWDPRTTGQAWPEPPQSPDWPYIRGFGPRTQLELVGKINHPSTGLRGFGASQQALHGRLVGVHQVGFAGLGIDTNNPPPSFWDGVQRLISEMRQHGHRWTCQKIMECHRLAAKNLAIWQSANAVGDMRIRAQADATRRELRDVVDALTRLDVHVFNGDRCDASTMAGLRGLGAPPIAWVIGAVVVGLAAVITAGGVAIYMAKRTADERELRIALCREHPSAGGCAELIATPPPASVSDAVKSASQAVMVLGGGFLLLKLLSGFKSKTAVAAAA